ncbi:MFS transporter [Nocardia terpenica]|uniref:MFS transporter n=1 Tax=Nocardia terpenica TaxID=455432 RepID=UPI002FE2114B
MPYAQLLRRPPVLMLWSAQTLSVLGDRFFALAIMWMALERSGPVAMGLVAIAESVPYVVMGAVGRRVVARFASFRMLAAVDLLRGIMTCALPVLWAAGGTLVMLAIVAVLGVAGSVFDPNLGALVPDLVAAEEVPAMTAAMDLTGRIARIAGPALAGVVVLAAPTQTLFVADAMTFVVSAAALAVLARAVAPSLSAVGVQDAGGPEEKVDARRLLRRHPAIGAALVVNGVGFLVNAVPAVGMPLLLVHHLHATASAYGVVLTASGIGALSGNLIVSRMRLTARFLTRFCAAWALSGLLLVATGTVPNLAWVVVIAAASGAVMPTISVTLGAQLAAFAPAERRRLMSVNFAAIRSCGTAGMAVIPATLADAPAQGFIVGGSALAVAASLAWLGARTAAVAPAAVAVAEGQAASTR